MNLHSVSFEETKADRIDTAAIAAFCNTCEWRGEWHHDDGDGLWPSYVSRAMFDADDHVSDTET